MSVFRVSVGETIQGRVMPHSEVCMHLGIAGRLWDVKVLEDGAQVQDRDGKPFSFPITHGEAGIYRDADGLYFTE